MSFRPPGHCPNCGEHVESGAVSCPSCGSCDETGWNEESVYDGLDLPGDEIEASRPGGAANVVKGLAMVVLLALVIYVFIVR